MLHDYSSAIADGRFPALSPKDGGSHTYVTHLTSPHARGDDVLNVTLHPPSAIVTRETSVNARDSLGIAAIIRAQTARDFSATLAEWQRASGQDRAYWRRYVRLYIAEERSRLAISRTALRLAAARNRRDTA